jgi:uncharacterized protein (DUF433 family)
VVSRRSRSPKAALFVYDFNLLVAHLAGKPINRHVSPVVLLAFDVVAATFFTSPSAEIEAIGLPKDCTAGTASLYLVLMDYSSIITIEPGKRSGKPCIRGLRITVQDILEYLAGGMTEEQILADFPELTSDDIKACLAFAADRERKLFVAPA